MIMSRLSVKLEKPVFSGNNTFIQPDRNLALMSISPDFTDTASDIRAPVFQRNSQRNQAVQRFSLSSSERILWISSDVKYFGISLENARES